jgi:alkanesulfonate monooxygenase
MSGGRVTLGLGAGWFEAEHRAQGIPFPPVGERFDRLEEQLAIITGFWHNPVGETFSFTGRYYQVEASPALPKPAQTPGPPVIVGGTGRTRTPNLAARFADEFNTPFIPIAAGAEQFARVRRACEAVDRDPSTLRLSAGAMVCCGENHRERRHRAAAIGLDLENPPDGAVVGSPGEVVDRLAEWGALGATVVHLEIDDFADHDHLRLLGEAVLPHLT